MKGHICDSIVHQYHLVSKQPKLVEVDDGVVSPGLIEDNERGYLRSYLPKWISLEVVHNLNRDIGFQVTDDFTVALLLREFEILKFC